MKTRLLFFFFLVVGLTACHNSGVRGNGDIVQEERTIDNFTGIETGGVFRVYVEVGEEASLKIEAEENLMPYIVTRVKGSTLEIDQRRNLNPREPITVYVTTPRLNKVVSSGASKIYVENIDSDSFRLDISGAGKVKLIGEAEKFTADLSGAGNLDAFDFQCEDVDIDLSGASKAEIYCSGNLKTDLSGVGSVIYDGSPKNVISDISGLGKVSSR